MSRLASFIRENIEPILAEWETFARSLPEGASMDIAALRDHAREMLGVIARDLDRPQTSREQEDKSKGRSDADGGTTLTAAQEHGAGRAGSGFTVAQMVSEFRALRASVVHLWTRTQDHVEIEDVEDVTRFNEAIDQAIAESITRFTHEIGHSKELFLAVLGHDLRSPLGAIITSSRFILDTQTIGEPALTLITRIASSARRMNQLVADLLEFTRTGFGESMPLARVETDIGTIMRDVADEVGASHPGSVLQVAAEGELGGQWDDARLTQALTNLVGNAVQHGTPGAPVRIMARGRADEVEISVHNSGRPIPPDKIEGLFHAMKPTADEPRDPRDRRDRRDRRHHLGLGLYIVDQIISAHGGSVEVESTELNGTTFTVHVPRAQ